MTTAERACKCPECGETEEWQMCGEYVDLDDMSDGDHIFCNACGEDYYYWCGEAVDADTYHENQCDSIAAQRYEESAHGDDREHYRSEGRWESGYRNGREDFRSDC